MVRIANIILCLVHFFLSYPELFTKFPEVPFTEIPAATRSSKRGWSPPPMDREAIVFALVAL